MLDCFLRALFPKCFVDRALLPEEGEVKDEENIAHNCTTGKETTVKEGMEADDVKRNRKDKESGESRALGPETKESYQEGYRHHDRDVVAFHHRVNKLEGEGIGVHLGGWSREDAKGSQNRCYK